MERNQQGYLTGLVLGHKRVGAHRYAIPSASNGSEHEVYIESIKPTIYRCDCKRFLFVGACRHGIKAISAEKHFSVHFRDEYKKEKKAQSINLAAARAEIRKLSRARPT